MNTAKVLIGGTALVLFICANSANAKKLFRYQDDNGQWHYSDAPTPSIQEEVKYESIQITVDASPMQINVEDQGTEKKPMYYANNTHWLPIEISVEANESLNIISIPPLPFKRLIPARTEQMLFHIKQKDSHKPSRFHFTYTAVLGDPASRHRPSSVYRLPFKKGQEFVVSQGFNGQSSHNNPQNTYAVDFPMIEGTDIIASRSGIVADIKQDFFENGTENHLKKKSNSIRILHDDGTMAVYAHLKPNRVFVYEGERVHAGKLIAESGNTGFSTGPHLHFSVQKNTGMQLQSIPFKFTLSSGKAITPHEGERLK